METRLEKKDEGYIIRLPEELVDSLRWRDGEKIEVEVSEWKGRLVLVAYRKSL